MRMPRTVPARLVRAALAVGAGLAVGAASAGCSSPGQGVPTTATVTAEATTVTATEEVTATASPTQTTPPTQTGAAGGWTYGTEGDTSHARVQTADGSATLQFSWSEAGGRSGTIVLPQVPRDALDCPLGCEGGTTIDQASGPRLQLSVPESADSRFQIASPEQLAAALAGRQTLTVDLPLQNGNASYTFPVAGLDLARIPNFQ